MLKYIRQFSFYWNCWPSRFKLLFMKHEWSSTQVVGWSIRSEASEKKRWEKHIHQNREWSRVIQISKQSTVTTRVTQNNGQGPANGIDVVKGTGNKYAPESLSHLIRYLKFVCRWYKWMRSFNWIFEVPRGKFPCKASRMKWTLVSDFPLISRLLWWIPSRNSLNGIISRHFYSRNWN